MKKIYKKPLLTFIIGAIIFGTTGVLAGTFLANNISYDSTNSGINANNVQDAIDTLYTKANTLYDEYSGTTTYTPSISTQTIPTNNKLLKSNITINPIPASYKELATTTTATTDDIVTGKTAYNNLGQLITGNLSANCVKGSIVRIDNTNNNTEAGKQKVVNYIPSNFVMFGNNGTKSLLYYYDSTISTTQYYKFSSDNQYTLRNFNNNENVFIDKGYLELSLGSTWNGVRFYYIICQ